MLIDSCNKATTPVSAQAVECRASSDCNGLPGDVLGRVTTGKECCVDNPNALAYVSGEEGCVPCVGEHHADGEM